jgi:uncharacterized protein YjbJ (UPF0337 family)
MKARSASQSLGVSLGGRIEDQIGPIDNQSAGTGTSFSPDRWPYTPIGRRSYVMDWNRVEGNWKQIKGKVKEKWGRLTDDDLDVIAGHRDQLEGKIQERYGIAKDQVRKDVDDWYGSQKW